MRRSSLRKNVGYLMYAVAVVLPLTQLPQIWQLYSTRVTAGLSLSTWIMYLVFGVVPLLYASVNRLRPLIVSNILWMVISLIMIYGILRYSPAVSENYDHLLMLHNLGKILSGFGMLFIGLGSALVATDFIEQDLLPKKQR